MIKILLADDEVDFRLVTKIRLEKEGYEVITAGSGEETICEAQKHRLDLILLDVMFPGINGLETLRLLKENPQTKDIRVIMFSGTTGDYYLQRAIELGAIDYVGKGMGPSSLLRAIKKVTLKLQ